MPRPFPTRRLVRAVLAIAVCVVTGWFPTPSADVASTFLLASPVGVLHLAACAVARLHDRRFTRGLASASSTTIP